MRDRLGERRLQQPPLRDRLDLGVQALDLLLEIGDLLFVELVVRPLDDEGQFVGGESALRLQRGKLVHRKGSWGSEMENAALGPDGVWWVALPKGGWGRDAEGVSFWFRPVRVRRASSLRAWLRAWRARGHAPTDPSDVRRRRERRHRLDRCLRLH